MNAFIPPVAIVATMVICTGFAGAFALGVRAQVPQTAELWISPDDIATRDLFHGSGGAALAPKPDAPYSWVATDKTGFSPGFDVRDASGREWSVKLGPESQTEVVSSRVLWAIGYHQPPTYYLENWDLQGGPGGRQPAARFRTDFSGSKAVGDWSWTEHPFIETQPYRGLIVANIILNSWDWKANNNRIYRDEGGVQRYVVRDLGASLGKTSASRLLWVLPIDTRGFGQGTRNDIEGFESQAFIKRVDKDRVHFDFNTVYDAVVAQVRPGDVKWTADLLSKLTDAQWDDAFRAGGFAPDLRARYIKKIKAKIAEGLAVS
jgi:hypothetical protein